jgi:hypothetical protein
VLRKLKLPVSELSVFVLESFNVADWVRVHRRKFRQLLPRRYIASHRLTAIARDRLQSPRSIPDRRSGRSDSSKVQKEKIVGPKGHKALWPKSAKSGNAGHEGPCACASPKEGLRSMEIFQGLPVAPPRSRSRSSILFSGRVSAMAGRQPLSSEG